MLVLFHAQAEDAPGQAQLLRRLGHVAVMGLQRLDDHLVFDRLHLRLQAAAEGGAGFGRGLQRGRQVVAVDHAVVGQDDGAFDHILQLAHIARPVIGHQHVERRRRDALDLLARLLARSSATKWSASRMTSLPRSRSGGMVMGNTLRR